MLWIDKHYINLTNKGSGDNSFLVEVETSNTYNGNQKIYSGTHKASDGEISVDVYGYGETMLKVYIDGKLDSQQTLKL